MEHRTVVRRAPLLRMLPGGLYKILERIILHDSATQVVESGISDEQGHLVGRVTEGKIHEMHGLADVHHNWDGFPVWMAEAPGSPGAGMENIAVNECESGLGANVVLETPDAGVV